MAGLPGILAVMVSDGEYQYSNSGGWCPQNYFVVPGIHCAAPKARANAAKFV